jgi:hypothetical protein
MSHYIETLLKNLVHQLQEVKKLPFSRDLAALLPFIREAYMLTMKMSVYKARPKDIRNVV